MTPRSSPPRCAACSTHPPERDRLSAAAWQRVQERFAWSAVARATVAEYDAGDRRRAAGGEQPDRPADRTGEQAPARLARGRRRELQPSC